MATDDFTNGGIGLFGYIILFVIIVWVFGCMFGGFGGNGFGWGNRNNGFDYPTLKEIFEGQKANITQTATTQYMIENQANQTRDYLGTKMDFYAFQDLNEKLSESRRENMELRNQIFVKDQLAPVNEQLAAIRCNMLRRPDVTGIGVACPSAAILNGLGLNSLNTCNNNVVV